MATKEKIIYVRDKNGKLISKFSNNTHVHNQNSKKNMMFSPTIDIVSNGESTLTFQMLVNSEKWQQIKNPENIYECNNRFYTALKENSITYNGEIVDVVLVETWYLLSKVFVQAYNIRKAIDVVDDHTVKILPRSPTSNRLFVNGVSYRDNEVQDITGKIMPRGSAGYALWAVLKGTDWTLGVCDVLPDNFSVANDYGTFNVESDMKSALENIQFIQSLYGGILDWDSKNKILNLRDERKANTDFNTWKGFAIRSGKNLSEPPKITYDNNLTTRLYPLGNGNLNIKKVNGNKGYIENFSYTNKVYEAYLQNANIYHTNTTQGQNTLKYWGEQQLEKICRPRKSIEYAIIDLRNDVNRGHETFDINHIVKAYYSDTETGKEIHEFLRIQHLSYNFFFPSNDSVVEVGDKIANEAELFYLIYKDNNKKVPTTESGDISGWNINVELPEDYWDIYEGFGYASLNDITRLHAQHETNNSKAVADLQVYADDNFATITSFTSFKKETQDGFAQSSTMINQVSTALDAQINLEARHHKESIDYTVTSVASLEMYVNGEFSQTVLRNSYNYTDKKANTISNAVAELRTYVDGDRAEATLSASYSYTNQKTNTVSNALADFKAYANRYYATASMLASYPTYNEMTNAVTRSEASVKAYASNNFASVTIAPRVGVLEGKTSGISTGAGGFLSISNSSAQIGYFGSGANMSFNSSGTSNINGRTLNVNTGTANITAGTVVIGGGVGTVRIKGNSVSWITVSGRSVLGR